MNKYIHFVDEKSNDKKKLKFDKVKFPKSSLKNANIPEKAKEFLIEKGIAYIENKSFSLDISEYPLLDLSFLCEEKKDVYKDYYKIGHNPWGDLYIHKSGKIYSIPFQEYDERQIAASDIEKFSDILMQFIAINYGKDLGILEWSEEDCKRFGLVLEKVDPDMMEKSLWKTLLDEQMNNINERKKELKKIKKDRVDWEKKVQKKREDDSKASFRKSKEGLLKSIKKWVQRVETIDNYRCKNKFNELFELSEEFSDLKNKLDGEFTFENKQQFFESFLNALANLCDSIDEHANQEGTSISDQLSSLSDILAVLDLGFEIASDILLPYMWGAERKKYEPLLEKFNTAYSEIKFKRDAIFGYVNPFEPV